MSQVGDQIEVFDMLHKMAPLSKREKKIISAFMGIKNAEIDSALIFRSCGEGAFKTYCDIHDMAAEDIAEELAYIHKRCPACPREKKPDAKYCPSCTKLFAGR